MVSSSGSTASSTPDLPDLGVGYSGPRDVRRLMHAILAHQEGELQDDATIVVVEWRGPGGRLLEV